MLINETKYQRFIAREAGKLGFGVGPLEFETQIRQIVKLKSPLEMDGGMAWGRFADIRRRDFPF